jgi:hypothetical protein
VHVLWGLVHGASESHLILQYARGYGLIDLHSYLMPYSNQLYQLFPI